MDNQHLLVEHMAERKPAEGFPEELDHQGAVLVFDLRPIHIKIKQITKLNHSV